MNFFGYGLNLPNIIEKSNDHHAFIRECPLMNFRGIYGVGSSLKEILDDFKDSF